MASIPETSSADLMRGEIQQRFVAGKPTFVALQYLGADDTGPQYFVSVHRRDSGAVEASHTFYYATDARRSFRSAIQALSDGLPSNGTSWVKTRTLDKYGPPDE